MSHDNRQHFRISPKSLIVELAGKEVTLSNISLGGAKFTVNDIDDLNGHFLALVLDEYTLLEVAFIVKERIGDVVRVTFTDMSARVEVLLAKYIMDWQDRRAYIAKKKG